MGKICWINGQPYSVGLPTGGLYGDNRYNQWDEMISFLGKDCDDLFHWKNVFSWCRNEITPSNRAVRGYYSARTWNYIIATDFSPYVGFRPVLVPLTVNTLEPDSSLLEDIPDGQKIALASLYMDRKPVLFPLRKMVSYNKGSEITLGDRSGNPRSWLYVIKHKDLLWVDRNILVNISWKELQKQGYTD